MSRKPANYAVTRAQKRYIARAVANKKQKEETDSVLEQRAKLNEFDRYTVPKGKKFFKHYYITITKGKFVSQERVESDFAKNWREYREEALS